MNIQPEYGRDVTVTLDCSCRVSSSSAQKLRFFLEVFGDERQVRREIKKRVRKFSERDFSEKNLFRYGSDSTTPEGREMRATTVEVMENVRRVVSCSQ